MHGKQHILYDLSTGVEPDEADAEVFAIVRNRNKARSDPFRGKAIVEENDQLYLTDSPEYQREQRIRTVLQLIKILGFVGVVFGMTILIVVSCCAGEAPSIWEIGAWIIAALAVFAVNHLVVI